MLKIKQFFAAHLETADAPLSNQQTQLACAALMIEIATIDEHFDQRELDTLKQHLTEQFKLDAATLTQLCELAHSEQQDASSLYQFTRIINETCSNTDKFELLRGMWKVARADGAIDKYEEYMIRKLCDLIHLPHSAFIQAKQLSK